VLLSVAHTSVTACVLHSTLLQQIDTILLKKVKDRITIHSTIYSPVIFVCPGL